MLVQKLEVSVKVLLVAIVATVLSVMSLLIVNVGASNAAHLSSCSGALQKGSNYYGPGYYTARCNSYKSSGPIAFRARVTCVRQGWSEYRYSGWKYSVGGRSAYCPVGSLATAGLIQYKY